MNAIVVELPDLDQLDRAELVEIDEECRTSAVKLLDMKVDRHGHGELVTGAVLITLVSMQALGVLATWLNRKTDREELTVDTVVRARDGSEETRTIRWSRRQADAANQEQLEALAAMLNVDATALATGA